MKLPHKWRFRDCFKTFEEYLKCMCYKKSVKNPVARDHWKKLGFKTMREVWDNNPTYIRYKNGKVKVFKSKKW